jgi:octaprenyl-diphosphate synthase
MPTSARSSLSRIQAPVATEMAEFQKYFKTTLSANATLLNAVLQYVVKQKGKQIRPLLVLLSAKACGNINEQTFRAATLVELLHTATLVHDDVVDEADKRRGLFSINALWKNKVAVLLGDFLLSRGLLLALENGDYPQLHLLSDAVRRMSEGELLQLEKSRHLDIDEATYFKIISDKTASLLSACMACGASSTTQDPQTIEVFKQVGEKIGLAFQIRDDLFDYGSDDVGKPLGIDVVEKKMTLPLIYSLREAPKETQKHILGLVRKKRKEQFHIQEVIDFVKKSGGLTYAHQKMVALAQEANELLAPIPASEAKQGLADLMQYLVYRKI